METLHNLTSHFFQYIKEAAVELTTMCTVNELVIIDTFFPHRRCHKDTWASPDHHTENKIDHITVRQCWRNSQDVCVKRGADIGSDHLLVIAKLRVKLALRKR